MNPFVIHIVSQHVGLSCINKKNKHLEFEMDIIFSQWMDKGSCYNTTIFTKLNVQSFKYYLKKGCKDRYELMCAIYLYYRDNLSMPDDTSSGSVIPMSSTSYK